jgi:hypothetical protein
MSLCSSRQSWKAAHAHGHLPLVTLPFTPSHKSRSCILQQTQSHWVCSSPDRRILRSLYVLAIASLCCFWAFLEHLLSLLNLHLAIPHVNNQRDFSLGPSSLQEILQCFEQLIYSLAQLPALRVKALLLDDAQNGNNVCKVFHDVSSG